MAATVCLLALACTLMHATAHRLPASYVEQEDTAELMDLPIYSSASPVIDVTKQIADIVVNNNLVHNGGVHTIPTIGDPGIICLFVVI